ncbi:acylneuraminate cytidylyltransferase family protein [Yersinia enterocolitica]|uniref:acylneuraminate cytidylyltransferase family protein n=1 Tax=Yersinia enterocolitica TaxID=630 RepID=UPI00155A9AC0|nr:acylneuraminate cytidylyltransferase family protein [Yersinia enterocolitica]MBX9482618.1 acylneuraminate cytidylyltransferase family protein [Yersinia enterocolitica]NQS94640.1 acylneuraminate cytidylyltransferase family protein [Yersinia enterocolitica]NQT44850.1 acylneuraminate cytidylyltransferase family protein [Yersinia enterocolitica]NQT99339.1 acylneuraminate cytidylyltransferase family protein [Yersinia enterocolitica]HDL6874743.1 acylneuraminate cytidylyltransferase family protein
MTVYAFIFARGGSKGLLRKNIKKLCNKPLIQYSIEVAMQVEEISRVFVSTDDEEIAAVAQNLGAEIISRPKELALDSTPEWLAWKHAIEWVHQHYGAFTDFVSLPATSPLRIKEDVIAAVNKRKTSSADLCIAITPASRSPFFNMVVVNPDESIELVNRPVSNIYRRQDVPVVFDITTIVYASTPDFIMGHCGLFDGKIVAIEVPKIRAIDIDDAYDFQMAEILMQGRITNVD